MHHLNTSFVLGYHGCSAAVAETVLSGTAFRPSNNDYDWLGGGIYFWESNPERGLEFYRESCARRGTDGSDATVVGAVIDLGFCLDLSSSRGVDTVREAHKTLISSLKTISATIPRNMGGNDLLLRKLDCAVINSLHQSRKDSKLPAFDSIRGIFQEGKRVYATSGFRRRTHVQIAVRDPAKIKGVFRVGDAQIDEAD